MPCNLYSGGTYGGIAMFKDPIVEEVRAVRQKHAAQFDFDLKKIAQDLRSMFSILGSTKDGKEFRKVLVDFDKFVKKLQIDENTTKKVLSLISEIRSFATIDEWLG